MQSLFIIAVFGATLIRLALVILFRRSLDILGADDLYLLEDITDVTEVMLFFVMCDNEDSVIVGNKVAIISKEIRDLFLRILCRC